MAPTDDTASQQVIPLQVLHRFSSGSGAACTQHLLMLSGCRSGAQRQFSTQLAVTASNLHLWLTAAGGDLAALYNTDSWNQLKHLTLEDTTIDIVQYQHLHVEQLLSLASLHVIANGSTDSSAAAMLPLGKLRHSIACGHLPKLSSLHIAGAEQKCGLEDVRRFGDAVGHQIKELLVESWEAVPAISAFPALTSIKVQTGRKATNARIWELLRMLAKHPKLQHVAVPSWPYSATTLSCSWSSLHITHTVPISYLVTLPDGLQSLQLSGEVQLTSQAASQKSLQVLAQLPQVVWSPHVYRTVKDNTAHWLEQKYIHVAAGQPSFAISSFEEDTYDYSGGVTYSTDLQVLHACLPHVRGVLWLSCCDLTPELLQAVSTLLPASMHTLGLQRCNAERGRTWAAAWPLLPHHITHLVIEFHTFRKPNAGLTRIMSPLPLHITNVTFVTSAHGRELDPWKTWKEQLSELRPDLKIKLLAMNG